MNDDLISREALKNDIDFQYICKCCHNVNGNVCDICHVSEIKKKIDNAPTVEQPTGEWIIDGHHRRCKKCSEYFCMADSEGNKIPSNFCPNCGAKMNNYHYSVPNLGGGTLSV